MVPNPGSDEALKMGCLCPLMDNGYGRESMYGPGVWIYVVGCPVHEGLPQLTPGGRELGRRADGET